jgi:alpha-1,2-mannosyltransferase
MHPQATKIIERAPRRNVRDPAGVDRSHSGPTASSQRHLLVIALTVCAAFGVYGWAVFVASFAHDGSIGPRHNAPGADFMAFYAAARSYLEGNLPLLFDGARFTAHLNEMFADRLSAPLPFQPWMYPPLYLLFLLPIALLPFGLAYAAFLTGTFAGLAAAVASVAPRGRRGAHMLSLLLCPAASAVAVAGQNGFLSAALLIGGFGLLDGSPVAGGMLFGALAFKPQIGLMVPVALVAARRWRALTSAAATAVVLAAASLALFGADMWVNWIDLFFAPSNESYRQWAELSRPFGNSVSVCALLLGATDTTAMAAQLLAVLVGAAAVWQAFRRPMASDSRMAVILAAAILAAPSVAIYDMVALAMAAGLLFWRGLRNGFHPGERVVILAAWLAPLFNPPRISVLGFITPLLICALMAYALMDAGDSRRRPATAPSG